MAPLESGEQPGASCTVVSRLLGELSRSKDGPFNQYGIIPTILDLAIPADVTAKLEAVARSYSATLFQLILARRAG